MSNVQLIEELITQVSSHQRAEFRAQYRALTQLAKSDLTLQQFLDEYLRRLVQLYAATAGAIWFRAPEMTSLSPKARIGLERMGLDGEFAVPHERLLQFALSKSKSFLVKPYSAPSKQAPSKQAPSKQAPNHPEGVISNPTDSFLVLGPIDHHGERIGVVEIFLGPTPIRGRTAAERNRYLLWLDHLLGYLCRGIEARLLRKSAPLQPALERLTTAASSAATLQATIRSSLEQQLAAFAGWSFGSLDDNQAFAARVQALLDQFGFRVACPQCGSPAILRCQNTGNSKTGVFLYDHTLDSGRTFHGGPTSFPRLSIVPRPSRRKSKAR